MRRLLGCRVLTMVLMAGLFGPGTAFSQEISLANRGFELRGSMDLPQEWSVLAGAGEGWKAECDTATRRSGSRSLRVELPAAGSVTLVSSPVALTVGRLYRLSGWVKTERAVADPTTRYPTATPATLSMSSFPFTNSSPAVGATRAWRRVTVTFFATMKTDRVQLHFGHNGPATGTVWFDDVRLEEAEDITEHIPVETVRWFGPAFRYSEKGWTFVHIEGKPYQRGYQYGYLLSRELAAYIAKLAVRENPDNAKAGWNGLRLLTDALMLRNFDEEYLVEMRGIADGAAKAGAMFEGRPLDFLDIVAVNSAVDLGQLAGALAKTPTPMTGRSYRAEEEELNAAERVHKCSSFLANGPATTTGEIVFGQLFMWNGYTGVHWDIICDVVPSEGRRLVYQTFPGGIHSGSDFYLNDAGIMIGETTVMQTPFNVAGKTQSSRIRRAAQYARSVDDVVKILTEDNNGLYTNDWLIGDTKANEIAILLLGTKKYKLWRGKKGDFPGDTEGFLWSVNNAKDPEVRREYTPDPGNAPVDVVFGPVNRDLAFVEYYRKEKGSIDALSAARVLATSPLNRPHACDGKVTTSEMAEQLMFMAHYGKVTLREKLVEKGSRLMPDLPNAIPHLSLGYTVFSPIFVTEQLRKLRPPAAQSTTKEHQTADVKDVYHFPKRLLWNNTVYPNRDADNWFVSGTAAYWQMLNTLPSGESQAVKSLGDQLADMNCRLQYMSQTEGPLAPTDATLRYDRYSGYVVPRVRGTFALHQLRLLLGNYDFSRVMNGIHDQFRNSTVSTEQIIAKAEEISLKPLKAFLMQWLDRDDVPAVKVEGSMFATPSGWEVGMEVLQAGVPYRFFATVGIETEKQVIWKLVECTGPRQQVRFTVPAKPLKVTFNPGGDIPIQRTQFYTFSNFFDDYKNTLIVYGTTRSIEANHTAALKFQTVLADQFTETLPPVRQDCDVSDSLLAARDLIVLGGIADNALVTGLTDRLGISLGKDFFRWRGKTYGEADDGLFVAFKNPLNTRHVLYLFLSNSSLQLHQMVKRYTSLPSWALFKGDQVTERGYHGEEAMEVELH